MASSSPETVLGNHAVILIPGIMGSALFHTADQKFLWGFEELGWYASAWLSGESLDRLTVTPEERAGTTTRIKAKGLLRFSAFAPGLRGFEPYSKLAEELHSIVPKRSAILEFAYDWRLSIEHNAQELAKVADDHLDQWRNDPAGSCDAQLVLVAHSMGGLVARWFTEQLGGRTDVALTLTLGTPYYGAVLAAHILNRGRGTPVPLPPRRLRRMARTMPGLHDLLPFYRCVDNGTVASYLGPADVAELGGDAELAQESIERHQRLVAGPAGNLRLLVGTDQPTMQSLSLKDGVISTYHRTCQVAPDGTGTVLGRRDLLGDGTVFRRSAAFLNLDPAPLNQAHGSLAQTPEAVAIVRDVLVNGTLGPPLGRTTPDGPTLGVDVPDVVPTGERVTVRISGRGARAATCEVKGGPGGRFDYEAPTYWLPPETGPDGDNLDDQAAATYGADLVPQQPGIYRVTVKAGGSSAVVQYFMVCNPDAPVVAVDDDA